MGQSLDAKLFYGVILGNGESSSFIDAIPTEKIEEAGFKVTEGEYDEREIENDPDWEEIVLGLRGVPYVDYVSGEKAWSEYRSQACGLEEELGIEIGYYGYSDYTDPFVAVKESVVWAMDGKSEGIDVLPIAKVEWGCIIDDFCKVLGIENKKAQWFIVASYG